MARRTRWLLSIIDQLPGNSRYAEAVANDDDAARFHIAMNPDWEPPAPKMRLSEWTPEVSELRTIVERLATLISVVAQKDIRFPSGPRPEVALDRVKHEVALTKHHALVAILLPVEE